MAIPLTPPNNKRNYIDAGFHGILAVLEALSPAGPNIPNVLSNLKSGFSALSGTAQDEPGQRAWIWAFKTISYAVSDVLKAERIKAPLSGKKDEAVSEFLETAAQFDGQELDALTLTNPGLSPLFNKAHQALGAMLLKATTSMDLEIDTLEERFRRALRTGSNRTLCEDPSYFRVLEDGLTGLGGESARRDGHWARHAYWVSHQYTDAPIFSPDEAEVIPLEAVYLPPRCFWHQIEKFQKEDGSETERKTAHVAELHKATHTWMAGNAQQDPVRVVTGGPGSGKSSFARAFAHEVIEQGVHRVLFIQLQHMVLSGSLHDDIARYVDRRDTSTGKHGSPGLPGSPLDWRKTDELPILIIFDGLDELSTKEEDGERYARELLLALKLMLSPLNTDGTPIRALVLGRNLACEGAMKASNIPVQHMLNVAPIAKMTNETCMMPSQADDEIEDPDGLMSNDQRATYWRKWATLKDLDPEKIPAAVTADSMRELNVEPLLLHLLVISKYSSDDWEIAADNKNVVYEDILQKIFERNKEKDHFVAAGVNEELFFELMECLGIAAWRGNGRTGDEDDFRQIRKLHLGREKKFKDFPAANLKSVALNIHTRAGQGDADSGFEFIHKSFGEYLAARGLLSHALKVAKELEDAEAEDVEQRWSQIIGSGELTTEIIDFLYDEAREKLTSETALGPKNALTELLGWTLSNGFSVHKMAPEAQWTDLVFRHRCAITALMACTSSLATAIPIGDWSTIEFNTPWTVNIDWPNTDRLSTKSLLNEMGLTDEKIVVKVLRRINLAEQRLWNQSLSRANLEGADLRSTTIIWSTLIGSNLKGASLEYTDGVKASLIGTHLKECDLSKSTFDNAMFEGVSMRGCDLRNASFRDIDASSTRSHFALNIYDNERVKGSIDLEGAHLENTDFSGADLSGVVNLSLSALNSAVGTIGTKLPDYINREKVVWLMEGNAQEKRAPNAYQHAARNRGRRRPRHVSIPSM